MRQMTLAAAGFERYAKSTRRAVFLAEMERVVPWPAVRADRAVLSQSRQRPPAGRGGADAAHLFLAAMVQPVGSGGGRGTLRFAGDARSRPALARGRDQWRRTGARPAFRGVVVPPPDPTG